MSGAGQAGITPFHRLDGDVEEAAYLMRARALSCSRDVGANAPVADMYIFTVACRLCARSAGRNVNQEKRN